MKLQQVLSSLNQIEKSKFITCLDKLCAASEDKNNSLSTILDKINCQIKDATGTEITQLFTALSLDYESLIREKLAMAGASMALIVNILSRDGNAVARISWIEQLYTKEQVRLEALSKQLSTEMEQAESDSFNRPERLKVFRNCLAVAYENDLKSNRQALISDDERTILNQLAIDLKISHDEFAAIEHLSDPVQAGKETVESCLQNLREIGVVFINRRRSEVIIADEVVSILNQIQHKELADKYVLRILRCLSDSELSNILKNNDFRIRGVSREEKVKTIMHAGINIRNLLSQDLFNHDDNLNLRKERLKELISELDLDVERIGTTIDERMNLIIESLKSAVDKEFNSLSASSYKEMFEELGHNFGLIVDTNKSESFNQRLKREFELENSEEIDIERLRSLSITPHDLLYLLSNNEIKGLRDKMGLSKRGNPRGVILEAFASSNDKLIENFGLLARRDLAGLKLKGIEINEAEIGIRFEEITKTILEELDLSVDEDFRKVINTAKDKADIIISISEDDVIVGEAKTCKNGDFAKYSTTSRQVKAYVNKCENQGKRVAQVLIVAPSFSKDFVESAEMDTEVNISLLTADGLKLIHETYKAKRNPNFSPKLFTKGGLLKAELIAKNI